MPEAQKKPFVVICEPEIAGLENKVSDLIRQGYIPSGSMVIELEHNEHYYYQPMVLRAAAAAAKPAQAQAKPNK